MTEQQSNVLINTEKLKFIKYTDRWYNYYNIRVIEYYILIDDVSFHGTFHQLLSQNNIPKNATILQIENENKQYAIGFMYGNEVYLSCNLGTLSKLTHDLTNNQKIKLIQDLTILDKPVYPKLKNAIDQQLVRLQRHHEVSKITYPFECDHEFNYDDYKEMEELKRTGRISDYFMYNHTLILHIHNQTLSNNCGNSWTNDYLIVFENGIIQSIYGLRSLDKVHPHVSSNEPCLGSYQSMLLNEYRNWTAFINVLSNYLQGYYPTDSYWKLEGDEERCGECNYIYDNCECCDRCEYYGDNCDCCGRCNNFNNDCICCDICEGFTNECHCCRRCYSTRSNCACCTGCYNTAEDCDCEFCPNCNANITLSEGCNTDCGYCFECKTDPCNCLAQLLGIETTE